MIRLRRWIERALPPLVLEAIRDLRALPPDARCAWWRAFRHHRRQRDRDLIPSGLTPPLEIVALCYGNIYRSPVAAALLRREAERRGWRSVSVSSAGFVPRAGRPSPDDARSVARELGVSLDAHTSSLLTRAQADAASLLLVMDRQHEALLLTEYPQVLAKVVPLWRFGVAAGAREEVLHDPYGRGIDFTRTCYRRIAVSVMAFAEALEDRSALR